jgi:hypothetical protein
VPGPLYPLDNLTLREKLASDIHTRLEREEPRVTRRESLVYAGSCGGAMNAVKQVGRW